MPQTDPDHFLVRRKLSDSELAQAIRLDIEAELDAINLYQSHIDSTDNELAQRVLAHIRDEEREHAALFWQLLRVLDPKVIEEDENAPLKLELIGRGAEEADIVRAIEAAEARRAARNEPSTATDSVASGEATPGASPVAPALRVQGSAATGSNAPSTSNPAGPIRKLTVGSLRSRK